jgi:hypothetical protein
VVSPSGTSAERFFDGHPLGLEVLGRVQRIAESVGPVEVRVSTSQVALRRRRGFAWLWLPGRYLAHPGAELVLSVALGRRDPSPRWKQVVEPAPSQWMHHLEVRSLDDVDDEVAAWLREAATRAA